jgi:hypothetical protein
MTTGTFNVDIATPNDGRALPLLNTLWHQDLAVSHKGSVELCPVARLLGCCGLLDPFSLIRYALEQPLNFSQQETGRSDYHLLSDRRQSFSFFFFADEIRRGILKDIGYLLLAQDAGNFQRFRR